MKQTSSPEEDLITFLHALSSHRSPWGSQEGRSGRAWAERRGAPQEGFIALPRGCWFSWPADSVCGECKCWAPAKSCRGGRQVVLEVNGVLATVPIWDGTVAEASGIGCRGAQHPRERQPWAGGCSHRWQDGGFAAEQGTCPVPLQPPRAPGLSQDPGAVEKGLKINDWGHTGGPEQSSAAVWKMLAVPLPIMVVLHPNSSHFAGRREDKWVKSTQASAFQVFLSTPAVCTSSGFIHALISLHQSFNSRVLPCVSVGRAVSPGVSEPPGSDFPAGPSEGVLCFCGL